MENVIAFQRLYQSPSSGGTGERRNLSQMGPLERASVSTLLVPVAVQSQAWVCGCSPAEIVGSNPAGGMDVCLL